MTTRNANEESLMNAKTHSSKWSGIPQNQRRAAATGILSLLLLTLPGVVQAQFTDADWVSLGSGIDVNGGVGGLAVSGTALYVGGGFTTAGGVPASNIAKWDGATWSALGSGTDRQVQAVAVVGTNLYAGGFFTTAGISWW